MKYTLIICLNFLSALAFSQDLKTQSYEAYISSDIKKWKAVLAEFLDRNESTDRAITLELALTQYGLIAHSLFTSNEEMFDEWVPATHDMLDPLMDEYEAWAEPYAVSSFIIGFQIADSPMKGVYLGSRSMSRMNRAVELDSQSPVVMQLYAGSKYFSPSFFGGDINEAIDHYLIAIDLFEKQNRIDEWLYLDALAFLGKSYMRIGETKKAITIYEKALLVEPQFRWVKNQLLPQAQRSLANTH